MSELDDIDYRDCQDAMRRAGIPLSPSEAHAIAIGLLVGGVDAADAHWEQVLFAELEPGDTLAAECRRLLDPLYRLAKEQFADPQFGLTLFLPTDDPQLLLVALRDWAQGFLYGFGLAGETVMTGLSSEGREALQDFYEIGQLDVEAGEETQDAEALMEVEEYMRVAAMLLGEDVSAAQRRTHEIH